MRTKTKGKRPGKQEIKRLRKLHKAKDGGQIVQKNGKANV